MIYQQIYSLLSQIIDLLTLKQKGYLKYTAKGFMDLNVDFLQIDEQNRDIIALSHNYTQDGDLITDPDMEIRIDYSWTPPTIEALSYQDKMKYERVYFENGTYDPSVKEKLNKFLLQWVKNLKIQKFQVSNKFL